MSVALPAKRHACYAAVAVLRLDGKIGAREYLATGLAHHVAEVIAPEREKSLVRLDFKHGNAPGGRAISHADHMRGSGSLDARTRRIGPQILLQGGVEPRTAEAARPPIPRRDVAVVTIAADPI